MKVPVGWHGGPLPAWLRYCIRLQIFCTLHAWSDSLTSWAATLLSLCTQDRLQFRLKERLTHLILQFKAAQYLRLAEEKGSKTVGNSW